MSTKAQDAKLNDAKLKVYEYQRLISTARTYVQRQAAEKSKTYWEAIVEKLEREAGVK